jgi:hypothetical protein
MSRLYFPVFLLSCLLSAGCDSSGPPVPETTHGGWAPLQEFSMDTLMIVGMDATQKRWAAVRKGAASEPFQQGVEKLGKAELPANLSSHKGLKDEAVQNLNGLIQAAKTNAGNQELEGAWNASKGSLDKLTATIEGK